MKAVTLDLSQPVTARDLAAQRADIALGLVRLVETPCGRVRYERV